MYLTKTPQIIQRLFPDFVWQVDTTDKIVYLTFDDGPIPEVTPWVLDQLMTYEAKATFFCVGENMVRNPSLIHRITAEGHAVGSHTYNHLSGWATENIDYYRNVRKAATLLRSQLYRPPYGRVKLSQVPFLTRHYDVVLWDILSGDFDPTVSADRCAQNVIQHVSPGSIVVFHDSLKSETTLRGALPQVLQYLTDEGYRCDALHPEVLYQSISQSA